MEKIDYKKRDKILYQPKQKPSLIEVPPMAFLMVDGKGAPESREYQEAMELLYGISYTIKMSKMGDNQLEGYFEYVVPPLEGLWWSESGILHEDTPRDAWLWTSMIRQPEFVTPEIFTWAKESLAKKKPQCDVSKIRLETFEEGKCVQILHMGAYRNEFPTISKLFDFAEEEGYEILTDRVRKHHEIYMNDPRKTAEEKLKTVIRLPVIVKHQG